MKYITFSLHIKILLGYLAILVILGSMVAILLRERQHMRDMNASTANIQKIQQNVYSVHRYMTRLSTSGESVIGWKNSDYRNYHVNRLRVDSLLQVLKEDCEGFVYLHQIDTLRQLLIDKENHLLHIMQIFQKQKEADSLMINRMPLVSKEATNIRNISRKKKGLAGLFGKREMIQVAPSTKELYSLNARLIELQKERINDLKYYTDNLTHENVELNNRLTGLVDQLDRQAQTKFQSKEIQIMNMRINSFRMIAYVFGISIILLFISYVIIYRDIKKNIGKNARLQEIVRENNGLLEMRKNIILTVSHDIRGPLGNINNSAELAMETREKKRRNAYMENIQASCCHILQLVNNLMDVYRINEATDIKNEIPFRLDELLERIAANYSPKANDKGLVFQSVHEKAAVIVKGDADKLERILDNLLTNAVKFTPSGTIRFTSGYSGGMLHVEVADTGIGMSDETILRIFRPFERAAQDVNSEGFGLGLSITDGLVKLLDGTIRVESEPGKGSTFKLNLPLPETTEETEPEEISCGIPTVLPKKVLVIDDDAILLQVTEDMLGRNGILCATCLDVKEAVARLRKSDYDLVLTDIQMPQTDGFGVLKLLRSSDIGNSRTVPVAVMTARGDGDSGIYIKAGFCGCIHKPFSMKGLLAFLSSMVAAEETCPDSPLDFSELLENTGDRCNMYRLVIAESCKNREKLEEALRNIDRASMRETVHRMMSAWELLGTESVLQTYRNVLHDKDADDGVIVKQTRQVITWIDRLINESGKGIEKEQKNSTDEKEDIDR